MRRIYIGSSAQKGIALLSLIGAIYSSSSVSPHRKRFRLSSQLLMDRQHVCSGKSTSLKTSSIMDSVLSSSIVSPAICTRGGAIDDNPRRRGRPGYYDDDERGDGRLPPRDREDRDRPPRSQRHTREDSSRDSSSDYRNRPQQQGSDRDRRSRYDNFEDTSSRNENRQYNRDNNMRGSYGEQRDNNRRDNSPRRYQSNNIDSSDRRSTASNDANDGKKKKWFTRKKDTTSSSDSSESKADDEQTEFNQQFNGPSNLSPPPPPPPPNVGIDINPAETERTPIHYMFPTSEDAAEKRYESDAKLNDPLELDTTADNIDDNSAPDVPCLVVEEDEFGDGESDRRRRRRDKYDDNDNNRVRGTSARRDAVTLFMATKRGSIKVRVGSIIVGAALGAFIGKSLLNDPIMMSVAISSLLFLTGFLRNDYGELSRALGLAFVLTLQRTSSVRKDYPTLVHLKAMIRQGPRKPFPPVDDGDSPWRYEPIYRDDPEFKMTYALLAMALVGSFCGGNVPILPAWMGGIVGAAVFASMTTGSNARGDLGRTMGMRVVGLLQLVLTINTDLRILSKAGTVAGLIVDKCMFLDRKHRIKDKVVAIFSWGYDKVSRTAENVKEEMQDEKPERRRRYDD